MESVKHTYAKIQTILSVCILIPEIRFYYAEIPGSPHILLFLCIELVRIRNSCYTRSENGTRG